MMNFKRTCRFVLLLVLVVSLFACQTKETKEIVSTLVLTKDELNQLQYQDSLSLSQLKDYLRDRGVQLDTLNLPTIEVETTRFAILGMETYSCKDFGKQYHFQPIFYLMLGYTTQESFSAIKSILAAEMQALPENPSIFQGNIHYQLETAGSFSYFFAGNLYRQDTSNLPLSIISTIDALNLSYRFDIELDDFVCNVDGFSRYQSPTIH